MLALVHQKEVFVGETAVTKLALEEDFRRNCLHVLEGELVVHGEHLRNVLTKSHVMMGVVSRREHFMALFALPHRDIAAVELGDFPRFLAVVLFVDSQPIVGDKVLVAELADVVIARVATGIVFIHAGLRGKDLRIFGDQLGKRLFCGSFFRKKTQSKLKICGPENKGSNYLATHGTLMPLSLELVLLSGRVWTLINQLLRIKVTLVPLILVLCGKIGLAVLALD